MIPTACTPGIAVPSQTTDCKNPPSHRGLDTVPEKDQSPPSECCPVRSQAPYFAIHPACASVDRKPPTTPEPMQPGSPQMLPAADAARVKFPRSRRPAAPCLEQSPKAAAPELQPPES